MAFVSTRRSTSETDFLGLDLSRTSMGNVVSDPIPVGKGAGALNKAAKENLEAITEFVNDDLAGKQWHLGFLGDLATLWQDYTGKGVLFGVYDSGVDTRLSAFDGAYSAKHEVEIDGVKYDGSYRAAAGPHGTSVAGLISARADGNETVGVSFESKFASANIFDPASGIYVNASDPTLFFRAVAASNQYDVSSNSWGSSEFSHIEGDNRLVEGSFASNYVAAVTFAAETGRNGLGTITTKAAGNSGLNVVGELTRGIDGEGDSASTDRHILAVAAFREVDGSASGYSTRGAHLLIASPSDDYQELGGTGIWTTDVQGSAGYGPGDYTDSFGGTSAATPIVSGALGLVLEANHDLGWRDVKNILAASALMPVKFESGPTSVRFLTTNFSLNEDRFHLTGGGESQSINGGGYHYSTDYGYGAINAFGATRMAEVWNLFGAPQTTENERSFTVSADFNEKIVDAGQSGGDLITQATTVTIDVTDDLDLEHIDLKLSYVSANGQQAVTDGFLFEITSPDGTTYQTSTLAAEGNYGKGGTLITEVLGFAGFRGESSAGTWTISITDVVPNDGATLKNLTMDVYGTRPSANDVYHYTDEFAIMAAIDGEGGRGSLGDTGGTDWLDFAAVTTDVRASLNPGGTVFFGEDRAFSITDSTVIENAVGGDGADRLKGNVAGNHLLGMRGDDGLHGRLGDDFMVGGQGDDRLTGGAGQDVFYFDLTQANGADIVRDFRHVDLIAFTDDLGETIRFDADGVFDFDGAGSLTLDGRAGAVLNQVADVDGVFYYALKTDTELVNAIALGGGPLSSVPVGSANTNAAPLVDASAFVPEHAGGAHAAFGLAGAAALGSLAAAGIGHAGLGFDPHLAVLA